MLLPLGLGGLWLLGLVRRNLNYVTTHHMHEVAMLRARVKQQLWFGNLWSFTLCSDSDSSAPEDL